jgi:hybrid cluster-associated redox disulfide protein
MKMQNKITKDMTFEEIFEKFPKKAQELASVMLGYGMHCVGCPATAFETIENGAKAHGLKEKDIAKLVEDLNEKLAKKRTPATRRNV